MQFHIENMTCGGCVRSVTRAIQSVDANAEIQADAENRQITVHSTAPQPAIEAALKEAGFPPRVQS